MGARRRILGVLAAVVGLPLLLVVPGVASKNRFERHPEEASFAHAFRFFTALPGGVRFDATKRVDLRLSGQGGATQPVRCVLATAAIRGWLCVALTNDGERFVAAWVASEPTTDPNEILAADDDPTTRPNK